MTCPDDSCGVRAVFMKCLHEIRRNYRAKTLSYHRTENDQSVIYFPMETSITTELSPSSIGVSAAARRGGSRLETIALEVVQQVMSECDVKTVCALRLTSTSMLSAVDGMPAFKHTRKHGQNLIKALNSMGITKDFPIGRMGKAIRGNTCTFCGGYGDLIHLHLQTRICSGCLSVPSPVQGLQLMTTLVQALESFPKLSMVIVNAAIGAAFPCIPGVYVPESTLMSSAFRLIPRDMLIPISEVLRIRKEAGVGKTWSPLKLNPRCDNTIFGAHTGFGETEVRLSDKKGINFHLQNMYGAPDHAVCMWYPTPKTRYKLETAVSCRGCLLHYDEYVSFMATEEVAIPGEEAAALKKSRNSVYDIRRFIEHMEHCPWVAEYFPEDNE